MREHNTTMRGKCSTGRGVITYSERSSTSKPCLLDRMCNTTIFQKRQCIVLQRSHKYIVRNEQNGNCGKHESVR